MQCPKTKTNQNKTKKLRAGTKLKTRNVVNMKPTILLTNISLRN